MTFKGWPVEAVEFFDGLEADNTKSYWEANRQVYDDCVRAPMVALVEELAPEFGEGRMYRPYRDVRFSKDKSPYKTAIAASFHSGGYVMLSAHILGVGSGIYHMAADQIDRYRRAVHSDTTGPELESLIAQLAKKGITTSSHDELKTAPKGYAKDHPRIGLLRYKDLVSWQEWPVGAWLGTAEARQRVVKFLRHCRPLNVWLSTNVGPTTLT